MARSRSSLTMRLLLDHGFWCDPGKPPDQYNKAGYFETQALKNLIKKSRTNVYKTKVRSDPIPGFNGKFRNIMTNHGYRDGPYAVKVDAFAWPIFEKLDPVYVKLYRDPEGIMSSIQRTPFMYKQGFSEAQWRDIIEAHHRELSQVDGPWIDTDKLVAGERSGLKDVVAMAGFEYQQGIVDRVVNRGLRSVPGARRTEALAGDIQP